MLRPNKGQTYLSRRIHSTFIEHAWLAVLLVTERPMPPHSDIPFSHPSVRHSKFYTVGKPNKHRSKTGFSRRTRSCTRLMKRFTTTVPSISIFMRQVRNSVLSICERCVMTVPPFIHANQTPIKNSEMMRKE